MGGVIHIENGPTLKKIGENFSFCILMFLVVAGVLSSVDFDDGTQINTGNPPTADTEHSVGTIYIVQAGDTLTRIANIYGTTVDTLQQLNGMPNIDRLEIGQQIKIPSQQD